MNQLEEEGALSGLKSVVWKGRVQPPILDLYQMKSLSVGKENGESKVWPIITHYRQERASVHREVIHISSHWCLCYLQDTLRKLVPVSGR